MKLAIVSLGCPKNQVDADVLCRQLLEAGHRTVGRMEDAEAILVNTCGFIQGAKEEAIEAILAACALKKANPAVKVIATGCLAERYRDEMVREIPELDAVVGIGENGRIAEILAQVEARSGGLPLEFYGPKTALDITRPRIVGTPPHYAYLKIAEGCSNGCAYCAIPLIRGPMRSRPLESCVEEARWLARHGVKELILVAQDVTAYGCDTGECRLPALLRKLDEIDGFRWIRLLYAYPERITAELLRTIADSRHVLPYIDMPVQHINDDILRAMNRRSDSAAIRRALGLVREHLPGAVLRTSLIAGFPGESEAQFEELCAFVAEAQFDRLGCFAYSEEEGTPAAALPDQVPVAERERRAGRVMELQGRIMAAKQQALVGRELTCICDEYDGEEGVFLCRTPADAPEIDTNLIVQGFDPLLPGGLYRARVEATDGCDLYGAWLSDIEE